MSAIGSCISIKPDSPNSLDYRVISTTIHLDQKVKIIVLSKMPRTQEVAENEAREIASRTNKDFLAYNPNESVEHRLFLQHFKNQEPTYDFCDD